MKLPFSLPFAKKEKIEYFLALLLREEKTTAVIFEEVAGKIRIIGEHEEYFSNSIESIDLNELLIILDKAISTAENKLPANIETQKTIFGLKGEWVEESKIKKEYLIKLKKICEELGLSPIGFLATHEAIAHLLLEEEGAPVSAILTEIDENSVSVSHLRAGKIVETRRAKIEDSLPKTVDKLLHYFVNYETLPSRLIIFNDKHSEKIAQSFISHSWSKTLPFLHVPQITTLPRGFDAMAIVSGAATQMGFEILGNELDAQKEILTDFQKDEKEILEAQEKGFKEETKELNNETFGFLKDEDILKDKPENQKAEIKEEQEKNNLEPDENDFFQKEETPVGQKKQNYQDSQNLNPGFRIKNDFSLEKIRKKISNLNFSVLKNIKIPDFIFLKKGNKTILIASLIIVFLLLILIFNLFFVKASVLIKINPKIVEENQNLTFSLISETNFPKNIIKGEVVSTEIEGKMSIPTSGKKEVGNKAKGVITIYNSSLSEPRSLAKGAIIASSNNLQFVLGASVNIASASGDASDIKSSSAKVNVVAKDIGKEYNLPSGTKFTIGNLSPSLIIAKNEAAFSEGSKKEITVVSKDDLNKLAADLPKELEAKARNDFSQKAGSEKSALPVILNTSLEKKNFSSQAGDEAKSVTLNALVRFEGIIYSKKDISRYVENLVKNKLNENLILSKDEAKIEVKDAKVKDKEVITTLNIKTSLIPEINADKLKPEIAGKSFTQAEEIINKFPQINSTKVILMPNFPLFPKILPRLPNNISIEIN